MPDEIPLQDFRAKVLRAWATDPSSAHAAASEALWAISVAHTEHKATVLVRTPDATAARRVIEYLRSYFTDIPKLAELAPEFEGEIVHIGRGRVIVLAKGSPRR